jgi:phytoene/squalene synthetase
MLESGAPLTRRLPGRIGWELRLVIQGGLRILERIDEADGDVFAHRPRLRASDWLPMTVRSLAM